MKNWKMADSSKEASLVRQAGANGTEIRTQPNKLLTEYLRYRGNDLATMQFSAIYSAMLSNNYLHLRRYNNYSENNAYYQKTASYLCK